MAYAIRIHEHGGTEALRYEKIEVAEPRFGEVKIRHKACGVNFVDTYFRSGLYPAPQLPLIIGNEASGEIVAIGEGVEDFHLGQRVAFSHDHGGYSTESIAIADRIVPIPDYISDQIAAAALLKGTTAYYLLFETFAIKKGMTILVHAAAGGVGLLLSQWANYLGAQVIGTVGSVEKVALAKANGCHHILLSREDDVAKRVRDITNGAMCDVVYDGVGQSTYLTSMDCLKPRGLLASFGNSSGPIKSLDVGLLARKGSLYVTRPTGRDYLGTTDTLWNAANSVFEAIRDGILKIHIHGEYPLRDAALAHRALESRSTMGALLLIP